MPDLTRIPEFARSWAQRCLASAGVVSDEDVRNVGDWLAALAIERPHLVENPSRLVRMSWVQAMESQRKWHDAIAAKTTRLAAEKREFAGAPDDVETVLELDGGFRWVRITSPAGLDYEGAGMGHCVGGGNYDEGCTILSLRDADNLPHCTVEWDEETRIVHQVQGRANQQVVERYHGMVRSLVDHLQPSDVRGAAQFGHIFVAVNGQRPRLMTWQELCDGDRIDGNLYLANCTSLTHLPESLQVGGNLNLRGCISLTHLPDGLMVDGNLHLTGCSSLTHFPEGVKVGGHLYLSGCTALTHLPDGLVVKGSLSLDSCTALTHLPDGLQVPGSLCLNGCKSLTHLPNSMLVGIHLNLYACTALRHLPDDLQVGCQVYLPSDNAVRTVGEASAWFSERFGPQPDCSCTA